MSQSLGTKAAVTAVALLLIGGALAARGAFESGTPAPEVRTTMKADPPAAPSLAATRAPRASDAEASMRPTPPTDADAEPAAAGGAAVQGLAEAGEPATAPPRKAAVRRSAYGLPKRSGAPGLSGHAGGMGGPTGHWTRFGRFPPPKGTARLEVTVRDQEERPVAGADVYLGPPDTAGVDGISFGDLRKLGRTDEAGVLLARELPDGEAAAFANVANRLNGPRGLDGRHGKPLALRAGALVRAALSLPFAVGASGTLRGRVLGPEGTPLASASVSTSYNRVWTKRDGRYEIPGVPAGEARLTAHATGHAARTLAVAVTEGKATEADIRLEYAEAGTMRIEGRVTGPQGEPVADADVYLMMPQDRGTLRSAKTDAAGRYVMAGLPERVRTEAARLQADRVPLYDGRVLAFETGVHDERVDLQLPVRYVQLLLRVLDAETGEPVEHLRMTAERAESRRPRATISYDHDKGYRNGMVEPGRHKITIDALDHEDLETWLDVQPDGDWRFEHELRLRRLHEPSYEVAMTVRLLEAGTDKPIGAARIEVIEPETEQALSRFEGRREDGEYRMPAPSGRRGLVVEAKGYARHAQPLTLEPDAPEIALTVRLRPQ